MKRLSILILALAVGTSSASELNEALAGGELSLDLRYRLESVDSAASPDDALASTLRTRVAWVSGGFAGFQLGLTLEDVRAIGSDTYNSTANGRLSYPVVADPQDTELDEGFLRYIGSERYTLTLGRQRIVVDNARFVGDVGFRQNRQTYDGLRLDLDLGGSGTLTYAHLERANRIFGAHHPVLANRRTDLDADLLHGGWTLANGLSLVGYLHLVGIQSAPAASHRNLGLRVAATSETGAGDLDWFAEYAQQRDHDAGAAAIDADYLHVGGTLGRDAWRFGLAYEVLGGDGTYGFSTPLATLHKFNGWADVFLATPAVGLRDTYLTVGRQLDRWDLSLVYHDFQADVGGASLGSELDLRAVRPFGDGFSFELKYADYDADTFGADARKLWVSISYRSG